MTAIRTENLSKRYVIGQLASSKDATLRDALVRGAARAGQRLLGRGKGLDQAAGELWALRGVNLEIDRGDKVGVIGRNGAGKSTLLKLLSRITEPTEGRFELYGRVASLLEVGTGFHPELTGRENIYLNGAILGMAKREIARKFDEIVDFSEIEKFLDTPVKRYSSGMYVRLAFAVAAHLEPEILVVDEVLAVGDAQFQKKCLGKMEDVAASEGRTVLFVSHQMGAVTQLCNRAVLLDGGTVKATGKVSEVVSEYMMSLTGDRSEFRRDQVPDGKDIAIMRADACDHEGVALRCFRHDQAITVEIHGRINRWARGSEVRLAVRDNLRNVFTTDTEIIPRAGRDRSEFTARVVIPGNVLRPQTYYLTLATYLPNHVIFDLVHDALSFTVIDGGSKYAASEGLDYGCVFVDCEWTFE